MAKRGNRLREFEKNNRVLDISSKQEARREKRRAQRKKEREREAAAANTDEAIENNDGTIREFKPVNKTEKINWKKFIIRGVVVLFIIMMLGTLNNIKELKDREAALQEKHAELIKIKEELEVEVKSVNSPDYIESLARKDLKLAKSNELIFYFDASDDDSEDKKEEN